jgi:signal peptidase I
MLSHDSIVTEDELPAPGKRKKRKHPVFGTLVRGFFLLFFVAVISISAQVTYDYTRYQSFYVNGESMYPTLNKNVTYSVDGKIYEGTEDNPVYDWGEFNVSGATYSVDYGLMDDKDGFRGRLNRFDIVVTYYNSDMSYDEASGTYKVPTDSEGVPTVDEKIKRLMAFPGEKVRFDENGDFYVNGDIQNQSFLDAAEAEVPGWKKASYSSSLPYANGKEITLGEDEYFVCGDNRLSKKKNGQSSVHSYDSRSVGPIKSYCLQGRAVAVIGSYPYNPNKTNESKFNQLLHTHFRMPWDLYSLI